MSGYDIWVWSTADIPPRWFRYTSKPFPTTDAALAWAKTYIPTASIEVRPAGKGEA
jgi:hypothetical protein